MEISIKCTVAEAKELEFDDVFKKENVTVDNSLQKCKLIPEGWKIIEDIPASLDFEVKDLKLIEFLDEGESYINGEELRKRAKELKANLGIKDCEFVLENQSEIPEELRKYFLVFSGTVLRSPGGNLQVAYLCWLGDCWVLDFRWLGYYFLGFVRLASCE